jgi:SOS-response transcriptional repressor LexA
MAKIQEVLSDIVENRKETQGLTQRKLAELMGAKPAMISSLLSGKRRLNEDWIKKFCAALDITLGDLEEPTPRITEPKILREYSEKLKRLYEISPVPAFRNISRAIDDWLEALEPTQAAKSKPGTAFDDFLDPELIKEESSVNYLDSDAPRPVHIFRVPHYDAIPAGNPREMNPEGQMWMDVVHSKGKDTWYTLRVVGDSMSPDYLDGDIVLMDYALQPRDGDVVAALIDGTDSTLKIYSRTGEDVTLTPIETKRHSPRTCHASRVTIRGVLIEIVRRTARRKRQAFNWLRKIYF